MNININTEKLLELDLTLSEYVYLLNIYSGGVESNLYNVIDFVDEIKLQKKGYIKVLKSDFVLRQKALDIFENDNLFLEFLNKFPIKAPSGRYLSPLGNSGILVNKIKKKWNTKFKNKPHLKEKAIKVLEAELEWRKRSNNLEYINNIETWLNQDNHEKFEYLLEDKKAKDIKDFNKFM